MEFVVHFPRKRVPRLLLNNNFQRSMTLKWPRIARIYYSHIHHHSRITKLWKNKVFRYILCLHQSPQSLWNSNGNGDSAYWKKNDTFSIILAVIHTSKQFPFLLRKLNYTYQLLLVCLLWFRGRYGCRTRFFFFNFWGLPC